MKKPFWLFFLAFLVFTFFCLGVDPGATQEGSSFAEEYVPNEVLVKFKPDAGKYFAQLAIDSVQGKVITYLKEEIASLEWDNDIQAHRSFLADPNLLRLKVPEFIGTEQAISILSSNSNVEYAEKNGIVHADILPNDPHFSKLWGMRNTGQTGGTADADIDAPEAWNIITGSSNIIVAVIDSGIDYDHEDLGAAIWKNPGESGGGKETDGIDNDGNGYVDDWRGWNFVAYPENNNPMDDYNPIYHGTHVSGTIGAVGNNEKGVTGVCWNVKLMALKILDNNGGGNDADAINAIDYATDNGAHLSNNSWGGGDFNQSLYNAIFRALRKGKLFVAAAGNDYQDNDSNPHYPSSYNLGNICAVLATDHNDNKPGYSNYGKTSVDIGAPGGTDLAQNNYNIYSTKRGNVYQYLCGTSMASPHVAGVAALAWGRRYQLTYGQLKARIINKRDYKSSLQDKCVANGRLNAYNVIYDPTLQGGPSNLSAAPTGWETIDLYYTDGCSNEIGFEIQRKSAGQADFSYLKSEDSNVTNGHDTTATVGISHIYKVRAYNMAGVSSFTNTASATIPDDIPSAPTHLTAPRFCPLPVVNLTWTDVANNEQYYYVERKSDSFPYWSEIAILPCNMGFYDDFDIFEGETYYYRVRCSNPRGYSSYSNTVTVEIMSGPKK